MSRALTFGLAVLAAVTVCLAPRGARAEPPGPRATPLYVLSIWTNDADDQAEGLTQALRTRVRQAPGWSLLEASQSFETLAIALRCPPTPNTMCLERIADQLHADHYVWGTMSKEKAGEVTADLRLWTRGKPEVEASETYSEGLKDPAEESLRMVAGRLFAKLTGAGVGGTLVVHAGTGGGTVLVDGSEKGTLDGGVAKVEVPAGSHKIGVRVPGSEAATQTANVKSGTEQEVTFSLTTSGSSEGAVEGEGAVSFPVRRVLGYTAIGAGAVFAGLAVYELTNWLNDKSASDNDRKNVPSSVTDVCATAINVYALDACNKSRDASSVATLGWIFTGASAVLVGTGIWLLVTDHGPEKAPETSGKAKIHRGTNTNVEVIPTLGDRAGAVSVRLAF